MDLNDQALTRLAEAPADVALRLRGISKSLSGTPVLDAIDLDVRKGEFLCVLGPSGCGKTTLLRLIAGFVQPDTGSIELDGQRIEAVKAAQRPINTVFQNYGLFPHLDVAQNVGFGLDMLRRPRAEIARRVSEMLELVHLGDFAQRSIADLSGGQQQRVALARALAPAPKILLLDEPLSALDRHLRQRLQDELRQLQQQTRTSFIFVTHDQDEALALADRVVVMDKGRIEQIDTPRQVYHAPASRFVASFVGNSAVIAGSTQDGAFQCAAGQVPVPGAPAGPSFLVVKPEDFDIATTGLHIEILSSTFGGAVATASARLCDGQVLTLHLRDVFPRVGDTLVVLPRRWHVLQGEG